MLCILCTQRNTPGRSGLKLNYFQSRFISFSTVVSFLGFKSHESSNIAFRSASVCLQPVSQQTATRKHEIHSSVCLCQSHSSALHDVAKVTGISLKLVMTGDVHETVHETEAYWIYFQLHLEISLPRHRTGQVNKQLTSRVDVKSILFNTLKTMTPICSPIAEPFTLEGHRKTSQMGVFQAGFGDLQFKKVSL